MKSFLLLLCVFIFLPFGLFAQEFERVEDDLDGVEEWHFSMGAGFNTSAKYSGYSEWETRNTQNQLTRLTYLEFMWHSTITSNLQFGLGLSAVSTAVKVDTPSDPYDDDEDIITHAIMQARLTLYFDRIGTGPYVDGAVGYTLFQGLGLQGGFGYAIELNPKESSLLFGFKYTYVKGTYRPLNLFSDEEEEHAFTANIASLYVSLLW